MHIALVRNLSPALEENVRSAFCRQVGGFICARRCQTTSQSLLTFGGLNKDFFLLSACKKIKKVKKIHPCKKNCESIYLKKKILLRDRGKKGRKKGLNGGTEGRGRQAGFNNFALRCLLNGGGSGRRRFLLAAHTGGCHKHKHGRSLHLRAASQIRRLHCAPPGSLICSGSRSKSFSTSATNPPALSRCAHRLPARPQARLGNPTPPPGAPLGC